MKMKSTDQVYAMKTLNKWEMLKRAEVSEAFPIHISVTLTSHGYIGLARAIICLI